MKVLYVNKITLLLTCLFILCGCDKIYTAMDESYQKATDPERIKHVNYISATILEYADKTGKFPFQELTTEKAFMVLIGRSQEEEDIFAQEKVLARGANFANSSMLEAELSKVLGREINLPRDPQKVATYAPNVYIYFVTKDQMSVAAHLYYPSESSVEYEWRGGKFHSHTVCYGNKK